MTFNLIKTKEDLSFLNKELLQRPYLGLDTEFRRTNKTNMKLSLLQINDSEEIYLIDCKKIEHPQDSCTFLYSKDVTKIFHSCKEDIEAIFSWSNSTMENLFDTQLACAFLDGAYSISYQQIVKDMMGIIVDKKETRTNWLKRPLTDAQLVYAASDVEFLLEIYEWQEQKLQESNKYAWLEEDLAVILSSNTNSVIPSLESRKISISKKEERLFLESLNETVYEISKKEKINSTLFFSKKSQKDFLGLALNYGLDDALMKITSWRRDLLEEPLSRLMSELGT